MAFHWQTFRTRALTALVFVAVMLTGLLWNHSGFFILFTIIHFGCWMEYQKLVGQIDKNYQEITPFHQYGVMIAGWCILLYFSNSAFRVLGISLHEMGWWLGLLFIFVLPIVELLFAKQVLPKNIGLSLLGLLYISLSLGLMISLRFGGPLDAATRGEINWQNDRSFTIPLLIIFSIWINDTMAYLVGSFIGKTPLSKISPKKTWEGTIGGVLLSVGVITYFLQPLLAWKHLLAISLIAAIAGTFGDLLESKLKRMAGVKDSGQIMPGHGGFLDRFDSLLIAIPFVWVYAYFYL